MRHCETQLLFLRLPLPSAPEPEPCPKKTQTVSRSRGTEGAFAPRWELATILASPARGTAAGCPPGKGCLPPPDHCSPEPLPPGMLGEGGRTTPLPSPSKFTPYLCQTQLHHILLAGI